MAENKVRMTHSKLPGQEILVREGGVKARERAGWKVATETKTTTQTAAASKKEA